jgi:hypothetical protein
VYLGSNDYQTSTSAVLNQVVNGKPEVYHDDRRGVVRHALVTSTSRSLSRPPSPASGAIPNGETVTFYNGTNTLGTAATPTG